jgi:hypothetical protein
MRPFFFVCGFLKAAYIIHHQWSDYSPCNQGDMCSPYLVDRFFDFIESMPGKFVPGAVFAFDRFQEMHFGIDVFLLHDEVGRLTDAGIADK